MKKLLFVFAIGIAVASCNNNASDKPAGADTTTAPVDTAAKAPVVDTTKKDTTATIAPAKVDSAAKK